MPDTGFLRLNGVLTVFPVSPATWWNGVKAGKFPKPVRLGPNMVGWRAEDIQELIRRTSAGGLA